MTREQALEIAKKNYQAHTKAYINELFKGGPKVNEEDFGYKHGWFRVGDFNFNDVMLTGIPYGYGQPHD